MICIILFTHNSAVLPDSPNVDAAIDEESGNLTINFSSKYREGIALDYYQIIVNDVTNLTVLNIITTTNDTISVLPQLKCTPYQVLAQARNEFGFSEYAITGIVKTNNSEENGGK